MTDPKTLEGLSIHELKERIQQELALIELKQDEERQLDEELDVYKQDRDELKRHISFLQKKIKNALVPCLSYETFRLERKTEKIGETAEEHRAIRHQMEETIPRKMEDSEKELKRNRRLLGEVGKTEADWEMLELAAAMSAKFKGGQEVLRHVQVLDQMKAESKRRLREGLEKAQQLRETLKTVQNNRHLEASQMGTTMSQLKEEKLGWQVTEEAACTAYEEVLDRKEKYFGPAQVETAIVNIHDMAIPPSSKTGVSDIVALLDKIQEFITDTYEILDQYGKQYGAV